MANGKQIHHRIKEARVAAGKTATWMADRLGIHRNTYGDIERGDVDVSVKKLAIISELTGRPISWFVYGRNGVESIQSHHSEDIDRINKSLSRLPQSVRVLYYRISIDVLELMDTYLSGNKPPGAEKRKN
jgi:transcriptional regulator with XRE-family HTH domain